MPRTTSDRKIATLEKELKASQKQMEKLQRRCEQEIERLQKQFEREIEKVAKSAYELGVLEAKTGAVKGSILKRIEAKHAVASKAVPQTKRKSRSRKKAAEESSQEMTEPTIEAEVSEVQEAPAIEFVEM